MKPLFSAIAFVLLAAALHGCNDPELVPAPGKVVDYEPWQHGAFADPPVCRNADFIGTGNGAVRCVWNCALYWTPGHVRTYRVEKCWARGADGFWREYPDADGCGVSVCEAGQ